MSSFLYNGHSIIFGAASFWSALGQFSLNRHCQISSIRLTGRVRREG
jgi:hypothetical protein